jgi:hypothetical protein
MATHRNSPKQHIRTSIATLLVIAVLSIVGFVWHTVSEQKSKIPPSAKCVSTGALFPAPMPPLDELAAEANSIIVAERKGEVDRGYTFKIKEDIKGDYFHGGELIDICGNIGAAPKGSSYKTTVVFLHGLDKKSHLWVPERFELSIVPQDSNGTYKLLPSTTVFTLGELQQAIGKQK